MIRSEDRRIPDNPLGVIRDCVRAGSIYWTYHVNMRIHERSLPRQLILDAVDSYDIIEIYSEDKYLPSYLVWAKVADMIIHILFAVDVEAGNVRLVTAYRPDPEEWTENLKQRKVR